VREYLSNNVKFALVQAALADGQTDPASSGVDLAGFDGVLFVGICGTITGAGTITMAGEQSSDDGSSDGFSALTGASAQASGNADSDKLLIVDIFQPNKRYVRTQLTRATANSVWGGTLAILYKAKDRPVATAAAQLAASVVQVTNPAE
jgi:hypothetical protein